jgi:hypothetical protein
MDTNGNPPSFVQIRVIRGVAFRVLEHDALILEFAVVSKIDQQSELDAGRL